MYNLHESKAMPLSLLPNKYKLNSISNITHNEVCLLSSIIRIAQFCNLCNLLIYVSLVKKNIVAEKSICGEIKDL